MQVSLARTPLHIPLPWPPSNADLLRVKCPCVGLLVVPASTAQHVGCSSSSHNLTLSHQQLDQKKFTVTTNSSSQHGS